MSDRMRLVKDFVYERVSFNHDPSRVYLVVNVTDDCMLELEGMAGHFAPHLFQRAVTSVQVIDSRASVAAPPPHHKHCSIWTVTRDGKKHPCDCVCECGHSMFQHIRPGEDAWYEDCAVDGCPCMKFTAPSPVAATVGKCEHGVPWSMECLSCGPSEYVAASPVINHRWRCACGWCGLPSEMTVSNDLRACPQCGGSGGLILDAAATVDAETKAHYEVAHPGRYTMTHPVHPDIVVLYFLALKAHWFDDPTNMFYGQREQAKAYLYRWVETGELADDNTTLEIATAMKFREWLESSWTINAPSDSSIRAAAAEIARECDPFRDDLHKAGYRGGEIDREIEEHRRVTTNQFAAIISKHLGSAAVGERDRKVFDAGFAAIPTSTAGGENNS